MARKRGKKGLPKSVRNAKRTDERYDPPVKPAPSVSQVFHITELLEKILISLPLIPVDDSKDLHPRGSPKAFRPQIQLCAIQRVSRIFCATITGSKKLQEAMTFPPPDPRTRYQQNLGVTAAEYGVGFARAVEVACESPSFNKTQSWTRIRFNSKPEKPYDLLKKKIFAARTDADTTWGEVVDWHHTGVLARYTEEPSKSGE